MCESEEAAIEAFSEQVFKAILGTQQVQVAWLGIKLGWYACLAKKPITSFELASLSGTSSRYAQEWCEHQTVSGWITCLDPAQDATERLYTLSNAQQAVLTNADSLAYIAPVCKFQANLGRHLLAMKDAYKNDTGISWAELGNDAREGQAEANRPLFLQLFAKEFLPKAVPELDKLLKSQGGRVADVGAGYAYSSIGMAAAYPKVRVDTFDLDKPSTIQAKKNIKIAGLQDRIHVHCEDVGKYCEEEESKYDLVLAAECIHDLGDPVSVLSSMRKMAGENGYVIVMDENVQEKFSGDPSNVVEQFFYGFSVTCCLLDCKSHPNSAETGTCMRPSQLIYYAIEAGFRNVEILPMEHDFFRLYLLKQ